MLRCASLASAPRDATLSKPVYDSTAATTATNVALAPRCAGLS